MIHTVPLAEVRPQPWRNGGGETQELLTWPVGPEWLVRISVARIERDGPFSAFPGVDRWFVVLDGAGVTLHTPAALHTLRPGSEPFTFDGAWAPGCELLQGPTQDLNLMVRRDGGRGAMHIVAAGSPWVSTAGFRAVFVSHPSTLRTDDGIAVSLAAGTLAWSDDSAGQHWTLTDVDSPACTPQGAWWMDVRSHESER